MDRTIYYVNGKPAYVYPVLNGIEKGYSKNGDRCYINTLKDSLSNGILIMFDYEG